MEVRGARTSHPRAPGWDEPHHHHHHPGLHVTLGSFAFSGPSGSSAKAAHKRFRSIPRHHSMGLAYLYTVPISWGGARGSLWGGIYGSPRRVAFGRVFF